MRRSWWLAVALCFTGCKDSDFDGVRDAKDCEPNNRAVSPDLPEVCDGVDNNCNGQVDEDVALKAFLDRDGDGKGDPEFFRRVCELPANGVTEAGDCDDFDASVYEGAEELCDELDNNCDGDIDEGVTTGFFPDEDGDGFGVPGAARLACESGPGESLTDDDCDDSTDTAYPGAVELCDGLDNDCDGDTDEGLPNVLLWDDADGDGYGDPAERTTLGCGPSPGLVDNALDCDDRDAARSLDAIEVRGNGFDEDCDGYVDELGVGPGNEFGTLDEALAAASTGSVVQYDSGLFLGRVDLRGSDVTLAGEGCDRTTLYADGDGSTVTVDAGAVEGMTISGGTGTDFGTYGAVGGGVYAAGDVVLRDVCLAGNTAKRGGGAAAVAGHLTIEDAVLSANAADWSGGGVWGVLPATITVRSSRVVGNRAFQYGGGLAGDGLVVDVSGAVFAGNRTLIKGAAVFLDEVASGPSILESIGTFDHVTFHGNSTDPTYAGDRYAEAIDTIGSQAMVTNSLFTGHLEPIALVEGQRDDGTAGTVTVVNSGFRGNGGADKDLDTWFMSRIGREPDYILADPSLPPESWDLRLTLYSDFQGMAGLSSPNPDGSAGDLGGYGGPDAIDGWNYGLVGPDDDEDSVSSALEIQAGTDPYRADADEDPDQDGATNLEEILERTDPFAADTDDDGVDDGVEIGLGSEWLLARDFAPTADAGPLVLLGVAGKAIPLDASGSFDPNGDPLTYTWSITSGPPTSVATLSAVDAATDFVPDVPGTYVLRVTVGDGTTTRWAELELRVRSGFVVPDDLPTLEEALANAVDGEAIGLRAGTWPANLDLSGRDLTLVGLEPTAGAVVLEGWGRGSVVSLDGGALGLSRLTVQGGRNTEGGGVRAASATGVALHDVVVRDNHALAGGGVWVSSTPLELTDVTFLQNLATSEGGHVWLLGDDDHEALLGRRVAFVNGEAGDEGGALYYDGGDTVGDADGWLDGAEFVGNVAPRGAAYRHQGLGSDLRIDHVSFLGNQGDSLTYANEGRQIWLSSLAGWNTVDKLVDGSSNATTQGLGGVWTDLPVDPFGNAGRELVGVPLAWADVPLWLQSFVDDGDPTDLIVPRKDSVLIDGGFIERTDRDGSRSDASSCAGPTASAWCGLAQRDLDGDGLPEAWELAFGTDVTRADAGGDPDLDGLDNEAELLLGTRPDRFDTDLDGVDDVTDSDPTSDLAHRPVAVVPSEVIAGVGTTAVLDASASSDPDGQAIIAWSWRLLSAPGGSAATVVDEAAEVTTLTPDQEGSYRLGLTVIDASGAYSRERLVWVVVPEIRDVPSEYATLEAAYDAAQPGDTVRLGAGDWESSLVLTDKPVTIVGAGADLTALVGTPGNPVLYTQGPDLVLRDLSVTGGSNQNGGGIRCDSSPLTLDRVSVRDNVAYTGAGLYLFDCDTLIRDSSIERNHASYNGGGMYADSGTLRVERSTVAFNTSDASAGGMLLLSVDAELTNSVFHRNWSDGSGAAMFVEYQSNKEFGQLVADHLTLSGNRGSLGAVHRVDAIPLTVTNSVFLDNGTYGFYDAEAGNPDLDFHHNAWFANQNDASPTNVSTGPEDLTSIDPRVAAVDLDDSGFPAPEDEDLRLRENSPAIDAGTGALDLDGSAPDLGAGGGPLAMAGFDAFLLDSDGDTMADVWETEHGLDPDVADGLGDTDGDGLSDRAEFPLSWPDAVDTDGDGVDDPTERGAGGDPGDPADQAPNPDPGPDTMGVVGNLVTRTASGSDPQSDPISYQWTFLAVPGRSQLDDGDLGGASTPTVSFTPDTPGMYVLGLAASDGPGVSAVERLEVRVPGTFQVPADYPDLRSAVRAAADGSTIDIGPGTWPCVVDLEGADVTLRGAGPGVTVLDAAHQGRIVRAGRGEDLTLSGLTLQNGVSGRGGALVSEGGAIVLDDVELLDNLGAEGGAIYLTDSAQLAGVGVVAAGNVAGFRAGMLMAFQNSPVAFDQSVFAANQAPDDQGGVFRMYQSPLTLTNVVLHDNLAEEGAAVYGYGSSAILVLDHVTATHNEATLYGAVVRLSTSASADVRDSIFTLQEGHSVISQTSSGGAYTQAFTMVDGNTTGIVFNLAISGTPVDGIGGNLIDNGYVVDFTSVTDDADWTNDDWQLLPTSDAVDVGDPAGGLDLDGSAPDLGAFGGPGGGF
jgi:hypothetical protein